MAAIKTGTAIVSVPEAIKYKTNVIKDPSVGFPELYMNILFVGDAEDEAQFIEMFIQAGCNKADNIDDADLVIFGGGIDVNPALYESPVHKSVSFSRTRDERDMAVFAECVAKGVPMFGVCRGMQFGHVMMNGRLYQDVNEHYGDHDMLLSDGDTSILVSSVHHQMVRLFWSGKSPYDFRILGTTRKSTVRTIDNERSMNGYFEDVEACFYGDVLFFGVQGHPEYRGYPEFTKWCLDRIKELFIQNPYTSLEDNVYRLDTDVIEARNLRWEEDGAKFPFSHLLTEQLEETA